MSAPRNSLCCVVALGVVSALCACSESQPNLLQVYAASSLTEAFQDLKREFEVANPNARVALTFAGSQVLRLQIDEGAPAHVFASANPRHLQALVDSGRVVQSRPFGHNRLVVVVPRDNPAGIDTFAQLTRAQRLVIGTAGVPVGRYARRMLHNAADRLGADFEAAVLARVVSHENNVRLVRAKVALGEADAAIVYQTDAAASERVRVVPIPAALNVRAEYAMGVVAGAKRHPLAQRWVAFVLSPAGQAVLAAHGFGGSP